jgi:hypothetical protein
MAMKLRLVCALPDPGCPGAPRGLFFEDTPEGYKRAEEFARNEDRPGWGVFECPNPVRDASMETFNAILEANGWRR